MKLIKPTQQYINTLMCWFTNQDELISWGGPSFSVAFTQESFLENLNVECLDSYFLVSDFDEVIGFGQFYQRLGKCHLGRVIIKPESRGQGLSSVLITHLMQVGMGKLNTKSCSLFVYEHNKIAISTYQKLGFELTVYPDKLPFQNCLYMVNVNLI